MCIRDRKYDEKETSAVDTPEWRAERPLNLLTVTTSMRPIPVSYTHLRAHETVLDLVCRLLLEKKTKNTIQTSIPRLNKLSNSITKDTEDSYIREQHRHHLRDDHD
mgnify:CR=1 FL=1